MGHTHYWQRPAVLPADRFAAAARDFRRVLPTFDVVLAGPLCDGPPILEDDRVAFNGVGPESCETFDVSRVEAPRRDDEEPIWSFCKTQQRPYDLAVRVALIVFKHHLRPHLHVGSDATQDDWDEAQRIVWRTLGFVAPIELNDASSV